jgi:hypothetical protein
VRKSTQPLRRCFRHKVLKLGRQSQRLDDSLYRARKKLRRTRPTVSLAMDVGKVVWFIFVITLRVIQLGPLLDFDSDPHLTPPSDLHATPSSDLHATPSSDLHATPSSDLHATRPGDLRA